MGSRYKNNCKDNWSWTPTADQQKLFEEWQNFCLGYLVLSWEGINARLIRHFVEDHVGEPVPLETMGFRTANHFLYQMRAYLEVRKLDGQLFIFVNDDAVPKHLLHVRSMVLEHQKNKSCTTKNGKIKRPRKNQTISTSVEDLLWLRYAPRAQTQQFQQGNSRPAMAPFGNRNTGYRGRNPLISRPAQPRITNGFVPRTSTPIRSDYFGVQNKSPIRTRPKDFGRFHVAPKPSNGPFHSRFVHGLVDNDLKSDKSSHDCDYCSGLTAPPVKANILFRNSVATTNSNRSGFDDLIVARSTLAKTPTVTNASSPRKLLNGPPSCESQVVNGLPSKDVPIHNLRIMEVKPEVSSAGIRRDEPKLASELRTTVAQGSANAAINASDVIDFNINDQHTLELNGLSSCPFKDWKVKAPLPKEM